MAKLRDPRWTEEEKGKEGKEEREKGKGKTKHSFGNWKSKDDLTFSSWYPAQNRLCMIIVEDLCSILNFAQYLMNVVFCWKSDPWGWFPLHFYSTADLLSGCRNSNSSTDFIKTCIWSKSFQFKELCNKISVLEKKTNNNKKILFIWKTFCGEPSSYDIKILLHLLKWKLL